VAIRADLRRRLFVALVLTAAVAASGSAFGRQARREFTVSAHKYGFKVSGSDKAEIRVGVGDLVHITFEAEDVPHSFTIDDTPANNYRVMKRAEPGKPAVIDFRADQAGTFAFFCNLPADERCRRETRGTLVVEGK
jgi:heme/copper-type cytochrome/quinol oxidase subunit 2